jgi:hypothetical protein
MAVEAAEMLNCTNRAVIILAPVREEAEGNSHDKADDNPQRHDPIHNFHSTPSLITNKLLPYTSSASLTSLKVLHWGSQVCAVAISTNNI